jgi:hypothetical protein
MSTRNNRYLWRRYPNKLCEFLGLFDSSFYFNSLEEAEAAIEYDKKPYLRTIKVIK